MGFTVIVAPPVPVPVHDVESVTVDTVYVVVETGVTARVAGLLAMPF